MSSSRFHVERAIPSSLLRQAAGYAILSVLKVGMGWSAAVGTGLVVARRQDGSWSPPSAVGLGSFGWGLQAGGELTDLLLVLSNTETVKARSPLSIHRARFYTDTCALAMCAQQCMFSVDKVHHCR